MSRVTTTTRAAARPTIVLAALAAIALSLAYLIRPAFAGATTDIYLQASQQGSDSTSFGADTDCGPYGNTGFGVVWHFILNQLDANTPGGQLTATFASAGDQNASADKVLQYTQHYYVWTPGDDILNDAFATVATQSGQEDANLVLSHVCHQSGATPTPEPTPTVTPTPTPTPVVTPTPTPVVTPTPTPVVTPTPTPEQSVEATATPTPVVTPTPTPEQSVEAATGTPAPTIPSGAMGLEGGSSPIPVVLFTLVLLISLGTLAYANVRSVRNRR